MRFLIDADLPRSLTGLLHLHHHEAVHVDEVGLLGAEDPRIARVAQEQGMCLVTGDFGFADVRNYPPQHYHGIVVLELPRNATAKIIRQLLTDLLKRPDILRKLPQPLAIVSAGRVRLKPK